MTSDEPQLADGDFIAGAFHKPTSPDGRLRPTNPADLDDTLQTVPFAKHHIDKAIGAAQHAQHEWQTTPQPERDSFLRRYQEQLKLHQNDIATCITREIGKPLWDAQSEVEAMIKKVDVCFAQIREWNKDADIPELPGEVRHRPLGVVCVIGPYNFPGHLPNGQILPALATGNTVIFKPSEKAPRTATWMAYCFKQAAFPPGVFNVVHGPGEHAATLAQSPEIDAVLFTGSARVGRQIVQATAHQLHKLVALELGGKNASIVCRDADISHACRQIAFAAFVTAGQRCTSTSRVYVDRGVADEFIAGLARLAKGIKVGHPMDASTFMGPVISDAHKQGILSAQSMAREAGYEPIAQGGACDVDGYEGHYLHPAIHVAPSAQSTVPGYTDTELFGPDVCVFVVDDLEQAIEQTNRSAYGLIASVFTRDAEVFRRCAQALKVGTVHWNRSTAGASGLLPFGGIKDSGNHRPAGVLVNRLCTFPQAMLLQQQQTAQPAHWPGFPMLFT